VLHSTETPRPNFSFPIRRNIAWARTIAALSVVRYVIAGLLISGAAGRAFAGGGPENVLLIVNSKNADSKTIANYYVDIRGIPPGNVVYVDWRGGQEACQGPQFWSKILHPAIESMDERRLGGQIDYIVYSAGIPWLVGLQPMYPDEKFSKTFYPVGSTNGVTYLWRFLRDKNPSIVAPVFNWYLSPSGGDNDVQCKQLGAVVSRGFRARAGFSKSGRRVGDPSKGLTYFLSTMLGVTSGRGNSVEEIVRYLKRSAEADGTRPRGTIYFMKNNNIRSKTRHDCYDTVARQLMAMGIAAHVGTGTIPQRAGDTLGIMTGTADFDFAKSQSRLLPGAVCDHLTSLGGDLKSKAGQTPLTDFLRYGAAGASGTVFEPLALQCKFPLPSMYLHYARGCSLAESFYQSIAAPYQLLIVGDPLCQPWAVFPQVELEGIEPNQEVSGKLPIRAKVSVPPPRQVGSLELFVDGRLVARYRPDHTPELNTESLPDGYHELRVVAVNADRIETRGRTIVPIRVNNHGAKIELQVEPQSGIAITSKLRITAKQPGATEIVVRHNRREVARFRGESGEIELPAATLGSGPVVLQAESQGEQPAVSSPVRIDIQ
jgi:hypothetical protein